MRKAKDDVQVDELAELLIAGGYSRKTVAVYYRALIRTAEGLAAYGATLDDVGPATLRAYSETLPRSRASRGLLRSALSAYWAATGRPDGPGGAIRVPTARRMRCRALSDGEAALLADAARARGDRKGVAVLLGMYAGLRRAEIAALRWDDIGPDGWVTIVGKGDVTRTLPLHPVVVLHLAGLERGSVWVFPGNLGSHVIPATIWEWVREISEEAGLGPVSTHVLRHTCLATALDNCRDLRAVQELAGHADPQTTAGYTRVTGRRLTDAVAAIEYGKGAA